ncbi:MAG: hypothetical protein HY347_03885 [candidate division NC10 bacterium]|nr:hypothetical protein [candidate division NC10 bacterium]
MVRMEICRHFSVSAQAWVTEPRSPAVMTRMAPSPQFPRNVFMVFLLFRPGIPPGRLAEPSDPGHVNRCSTSCLLPSPCQRIMTHRSSPLTTPILTPRA